MRKRSLSHLINLSKDGRSLEAITARTTKPRRPITAITGF
jgi:hypothetical protein